MSSNDSTLPLVHRQGTQGLSNDDSTSTNDTWPTWQRNPSDRALSENRLTEIYRSFAVIIKANDHTPAINERFGDLLDLQIHVDSVEPLGPNKQFHALECAMQKCRYHLCRLQMDELRTLLGWTYSEGKMERLIFRNWSLIIDDIRFRLTQLITASKLWLEKEPPVFQMLSERHRQWPKDYRKAKEVHPALPNHHSEKVTIYSFFINSSRE